MTQTFIEGNVRFTVLTECLLRIEQTSNGNFIDLATTTVINRDFPNVEVKVLRNQNGHALELITKGFHLYYDGGELTAISLYVDMLQASSLYQNRWYFGQPNGKKNLKGTIRTLDGVDGATTLDDGIQSKDGYSCLDDTNSFLFIEEEDCFKVRDEKGTDIYLFCYGHNYQEALTAYFQLTGFPPLIPRFALGNWWSRFYPYTQDEYKQLMDKFEERKVPIHVSVFDIDWHKRKIPQQYGSGWTGYSWNRELFPNPSALLAWLHQKGKKVTLNVHPAAGIRAFEDQYPEVANALNLDVKNEEPASFDLENRAFRDAYFDLVHHPLEKEGVDFWWIDWQQGLAKVANSLDPMWLLNYYHYVDNAKEHHGDGLILSRYAGPGSHRYPVGFSGDTVISWDSLAFQPYFTSTAANIGYTWWSHDIGGHMRGSFDGELATRWLQFGTFSPINRLHSSNNHFSGKEPWNYRSDQEAIQEKFLRLRSQLIPYIESANVLTHTQGIPIVEPLYYRWPECAEAYTNQNQYIFCGEMLAAPIVRPQDSKSQSAYSWIWLPKGEWVDYFSHLTYDGNTSIKAYRRLDDLPVFVRRGSIVVTNPEFGEDVSNLPKLLKAEVFPGQSTQYILYEHEGSSIAQTIFKWEEEKQELTWEVEDPDHILPVQREIQVEVISYRLEDCINELEVRIRLSHESFDLKQKIYEEFISSDYDYGAFINNLSRIEDQDLRDSLAEIAYVRRSYDKDEKANH